MNWKDDMLIVDRYFGGKLLIVFLLIGDLCFDCIVIFMCDYFEDYVMGIVLNKFVEGF